MTVAAEYGVVYTDGTHTGAPGAAMRIQTIGSIMMLPHRKSLVEE